MTAIYDSKLLARFWAKVDKSGDCWLWTASTSIRTGYGYFSVTADGRKRVRTAHRVSYEIANGRIPDGMQIDHICHVSVCVNPSHLRTVTSKQNSENRRGATSASTTGVRGVLKMRPDKWRAELRHHGINVHVGYFDTLEEANAAVVAKRQEVFTHNNADWQAAS